MSDPPVDPRTESDSGRPTRRPRSVLRRPSYADDALSEPTVQIPAQLPSAYYEQAGTDRSEELLVPTGYAPAGEVADYDDYAEYSDEGTTPPPVAIPAPAGRPRVRKVSRVVRAVDAWSVFKVSLIFYLALYVVCLIAGVLLWNVAHSTGTIDNISNFFESFGWKSFEFKGGEIYHNGWILGLFLVIGLTGLNVVLATLFNLIADLVGGVRLTVLEEEVTVRRVGGSGPIEQPTTSPLAPNQGLGWGRFRRKR